MSIRKAHPLGRKRIDIWGRDLRLRIVAADISVAEVVSKNENNIRFLCHELPPMSTMDAKSW